MLRGRCLPYGEGITYWPLVEIGRRIAGGGEDDLRALIGDEHDAEPVAAALASVIGRSQTPVSIDDAGWAVRRLFESLARERPLVVSFEDVNWAEPTLLDLIEHIAEWTRDAPVMLVCTAREELIEQRPTWAGGLRNAATAFLEPLSDGDSAELVEQLGGELAAAKDTVSRVVALSGGNPLFVEQLLATMGSEQQPDVGALSTIHAVIGARLDALSPVERELLECASVIGKEFWPEPVYAAMREDPNDTLSELMRKDLVRHARSAFHGQAAYRFGHLLVRDAAYARIPKRRRAELHERFVGWMDTADPGEEPEIADVIGYHLEQAHRLRAELGPPDEAARALATRAGGALAEAGSRAQRRMDAPAAANLLSRAAALYADERPARLELLPELALSQLLIGELERARGTLDEALSTSIELADRRNEQRALMGHAYALWTATGAGIQLGRAVERAIPALEQAGDAPGLVRAWLWRGFAYQSESRYGDAAEAHEQALVHLASAPGIAEERAVFGNLALTLWLGPEPAESAITRMRLLVERERERHSTAEAYVAVPLAMMLAECGRAEEASAVLAAAGELFDRNPAPRLRAEVAHHSGRVHIAAGDLEAAERSLRMSLEMSDAATTAFDRSEVEAALARVLCETGRWQEALAMAGHSREHAAPADVGNQIAWRSALARALSGVGRADEAAPLAAAAVEIAERTDSPGLQADALLVQAEVLHEAGRPEAAAAAEQALARCRQKGITAPAARAQRLADQAGSGARGQAKA